MSRNNRRRRDITVKPKRKGITPPWDSIPYFVLPEDPSAQHVTTAFRGRSNPNLSLSYFTASHPSSHHESFAPLMQSPAKSFQQRSQQESQQAKHPPGLNDYQVLERLKEQIKNSQHQFFRAIPQPEALENLFLGPNTHPQLPASRSIDSSQTFAQHNHSSATAVQNSVQEDGRKDPITPSRTTYLQSSAAIRSNDSTFRSPPPVNRPPDTVDKASTRPLSSPDHNAPQRQLDYDTRNENPTNGPPSIKTEPGQNEPSLSINSTSGVTSLDKRKGYDDYSRARDSDWSRRDNDPSLSDRRQDDSLHSVGRSGIHHRSDPSPDRGPLPPRDQVYDRGRDRERERLHDRDSWDRRQDYRAEYSRPLGPRPEQRHYEPEYGRNPPRQYDSRERDEPSTATRRYSDARPSDTMKVNEQPALRPASQNDRIVSSPANVHPLAESRTLPDARTSSNTRNAGPVAENPRGRSMSVDENRRPTNDHARIASTSAPHTSHENTTANVSGPSAVATRPPAKLEERLSSRPSLRDRIGEPITHPPLPKAEVSRGPQPTLEERLSSNTIRDRVNRPPPASAPAEYRPRAESITDLDQDRPVRLLPLEDRLGGHPREDDRDVRSTYDRGVTPEGSYAPRSSYLPPSRSNSVRDDPRPAGRAYSPPPRREYRRDSSRDQPDFSRANNYRPAEIVRSYDDRHSSDYMDVESTYQPRYADRNYRDFSPPSAADLARDRLRAQYPPGSSPPARIPSLPPPPRMPSLAPDSSYDRDRNRNYAPPPRDYSYPPYNDRRRDWTPAEEEYWRSRHWDNRRGASIERDRYNSPPPAPPPARQTWDDRSRERRGESYRPPSPPPSSRVYEASRPLGSRLTDGYPPERHYEPPADRNTNSYNGNARIRPRSPSPPPVRRPPPAGPPSTTTHLNSTTISSSGAPPTTTNGSTDDGRPPVKRQRDDSYNSNPSDYYTRPTTASATNNGTTTVDTSRRPSVAPAPTPSSTSGYDRSNVSVSSGNIPITAATTSVTKASPPPLPLPSSSSSSLPPPTSNASSHYDRPGSASTPTAPPTTGSTTASTSSGGVFERSRATWEREKDRDRERERDRLPDRERSRERDRERAYMSYDRPRSPIGRGGYGFNRYRPDPRDDRRYMPPPPPPRTS